MSNVVSRPLIWLFLAILIFSCEDPIDLNPSIVTEDALLVSGERMRLSGRVITTQSINASDHGFYISDNEGFSQPTIISLGARENPGRFIGETSGLSIERPYFVKAFAELPDGILFGNVLNIETLSPNVFNFSPTDGAAGTIVTITGVNLTQDVRVFFGDNEAEVLDIDFESVLRVRVPPIGNESSVPVRVVIQEKELQVQGNYEYSTGVYTKLFQFPGNVRFIEGISLREGNTFYSGMGTDQSSALNNTFWKYNVGDTDWIQIDPPSRVLRRAFSSETYYGGGSASFFPFVTVRDFVKLENGNFEVLPDLPFNFINGKGFELSGKLYLAGGDEGNGIYEYDPSSGNWSTVGTVPYRILNNNFSFSYQNRQYFINPETRDLIMFNPEDYSWNTVGSYPGELGNNGNGLAITIGSKVFLGLGNRSSQMWELDMNTLNWLRKNDFAGSNLARIAGAYVVDEEIYFLRSPESQLGGSVEFWRFDPFAF